MHRIDGPYVEADKFGAGKDGFTNGEPGVTAPTEVDDDWLDGVQEEICNVIEGNGTTLAKGTRDQLYDVLRNPVGEASTPAIAATVTSGNASSIIGTGKGTGHGMEGTASGESNSSVGVRGVGDVSGAATSSDGVSGEGAGTSGNGVTGTGAGAGHGVNGTSASTGDAVHGEAASGAGIYGKSTAGYGAVAEGDTTSPAKSSLRVVPQDAVPTGPNALGDVRFDPRGMPTVCIAAGSPGTFGKIGMTVGSSGTTSSTVTNTTSEVNFDESVDIPADFLQVGDVITVSGWINVIGYTGTPTLTIRGKLDAQAFGGAIIPIDATTDYLFVQIQMIVKAIGASGDIDGFTMVQTIDAAGTVGAVYGDVAIATAVDTTQDLTAQISAQWSVASPSNQTALRGISVRVN